ncbi:MAG: ATP-binding protein, partial [Verrucomicrobia bacterium]|nr:ATP-binding protein [Verrucomicrobiota bacterium]
MIARNDIHKVEAALDRQAAVALLGPRQSGKTTLALALSKKRPSLYFDLELKSDRDKLTDPEFFLQRHQEKLIILDEIHHMPDLFATLRGLIDQGRRQGKKKGRFLILGSAAIDLLRQSETLAGRIEYIELTPFTALEVGKKFQQREQLWLRGGFPESFLSKNNKESFRLRRAFIRTYLERDVPQFGPRVPAGTLERLWMMLAHNQGTLLNASRLAAGLSLSAPTVTTYVSLLTDLFLVRRLLPYVNNFGKRMVKTPKTYIRDSGLLHALLGLEEMDGLLGHPVVGFSWEGFVIENLLAVAPQWTQASFYRTAAGAEIDLLL